MKDNEEFYVNVNINFKVRSSEPNGATSITSKLILLVNKFLELLPQLGSSSNTTDVEMSVKEIYNRCDEDDD